VSELRQQYNALGAELDVLNIQFVTEGVFAVEVKERGVVHPERFFIAIPREEWDHGPPPPPGEAVEGDN
jgi:hypothetical protein